MSKMLLPMMMMMIFVLFFDFVCFVLFLFRFCLSGPLKCVCTKLLYTSRAIVIWLFSNPAPQWSAGYRNINVCCCCYFVCFSLGAQDSRRFSLSLALPLTYIQPITLHTVTAHIFLTCLVDKYNLWRFTDGYNGHYVISNDRTAMIVITLFGLK